MFLPDRAPDDVAAGRIGEGVQQSIGGRRLIGTVIDALIDNLIYNLIYNHSVVG